MDPNDGTINGTDVDHILKVIDDEGNPGKANPNNKTQHSSYYPCHGTSLIAHFSGNLIYMSDNKTLNIAIANGV